MIRAFGWCNEAFDILSPNRLCRGRERWMEGLPDTPKGLIYRTVMSGAIFSDDSARDAQRGFTFSGVGAGRLLAALIPGATILGYCEHGDPRALPAKLILEEDFTRAMWGGLRYEPAVRWLVQARSDEVDALLSGYNEAGEATPQADAFVIVKGTIAEDRMAKLVEGLFLLCGHGEPDDRPARKYNPTALPILLEEATAVVLLHLDKHGPVLAVYTKEPLEADELLRITAKAAGAFPIPFAIPPMLARWDRALYELRMDWNAEQDGEFPVPPAEDAGGRWSMRRKMLEAAQARLALRQAGLDRGEEDRFDEEGLDRGFDGELDRGGDDRFDEGEE